MFCTMSISCAPSRKAACVSATLASVDVAPSGNPTTVQTLTWIRRARRRPAETSTRYADAREMEVVASLQSFKISARVASGRSRVWSMKLRAFIDHTLLRPEATHADILQLCREALEYNFASVCVNAYWVPLAASQLAGSDVKVCTVVGFPLGATSTEAKVAETEAALRAGAQEIDMVLNIGALRGDDDRAVEEEIALVAAACHRGGAIVKVILETSLLNDDQKIVACKLSQMAGADFVKTSTGFSSSGATVHDVELMRRAVGPEMGVKASGGIRTLDDLLKMLVAGATRIGASAGVKIVEAARATSRGGAGA